MQVHMPGGMKMLDKSTDVVAGLAVLSWMNPTLLSWLTDFSQLAALITPILGFLWLTARFGVWGYRKIAVKYGLISND